MTRGRIIQLRGPSGSGKTTVMRRVMETLGTPVRVRPKDDPTRRSPSILVWPQRGVAVIGHYDVLCGGCDTIKSRERPYELARMAADQGMNVLLEGLFTTMEYHRTLALQADGYERHDVFIRPPEAECRRNVEARRTSQGKEIKEQKQMAEYYRRVARTLERLQLAGLNNLTWLEGPTAEVGERAVQTILGLALPDLSSGGTIPAGAAAPIVT